MKKIYMIKEEYDDGDWGDYNWENYVAAFTDFDAAKMTCEDLYKENNKEDSSDTLLYEIEERNTNDNGDDYLYIVYSGSLFVWFHGAFFNKNALMDFIISNIKNKTFRYRTHYITQTYEEVRVALDMHDVMVMFGKLNQIDGWKKFVIEKNGDEVDLKKWP